MVLLVCRGYINNQSDLWLTENKDIGIKSPSTWIPVICVLMVWRGFNVTSWSMCECNFIHCPRKMEVLSPGPGKELEFEPIEIPELNNNGSDPQSEDKVVKVYVACSIEFDLFSKQSLSHLKIHCHLLYKFIAINLRLATTSPTTVVFKTMNLYGKWPKWTKIIPLCWRVRFV